MTLANVAHVAADAADDFDVAVRIDVNAVTDVHTVL